MISAEVSIDLPLFTAHRQNPLLAARISEVAALDDERADMLRSHTADLERDIADYQRRERQHQRIVTAGLPLAEQALALAYRGYGASTTSLAELLEARRARAETRLRALDLRAATLEAAAQLYFTYEGGEHD